MKKLLSLVFVFGLAGSGVSCGSGGTATPGDGAAGTGGGGSGGAGGGDTGDASAAGTGGTDPLNPDCPEGTNDKSALPGQINLFPGTATSLQYRQSCITIKAGQSFKFSGDFSEHPLRAKSATTTNPIPALTSTGTELTVVFPNAGTFNYDCKNHPADMFGTVNVKP